MKIKGPLLSVGASGSVGNVLTFSKRKTHQHARNKQGANKKLTPAQAEWRLLFDFVSLKWQSLTDDQKNVYRNLGKELNPSLTGFQYLAKIGMQSPKDYLDLECFFPLMKKSATNTYKDYSGNNEDIAIYDYTSERLDQEQYNTKKTRWRLNRKTTEVYLQTITSNYYALERNNFTMNFLYKMKTYGQQQDLVRILNYSIPKTGFKLLSKDEGFVFSVYDGETRYYPLFDPVTNYFNRTMYISFVFTDGKITLYVNGVFEKEVVSVNFIMNVANRVIFWNGNTLDPTSTFNLGQFSLLKRALSESECLFLYKALKLNETYE